MCTVQKVWPVDTHWIWGNPFSALDDTDSSDPLSDILFTDDLPTALSTYNKMWWRAAEAFIWCKNDKAGVIKVLIPTHVELLQIFQEQKRTPQDNGRTHFLIIALIVMYNTIIIKSTDRVQIINRRRESMYRSLRLILHK